MSFMSAAVDRQQVVSIKVYHNYRESSNVPVTTYLTTHTGLCVFPSPGKKECDKSHCVILINNMLAFPS